MMVGEGSAACHLENPRGISILVANSHRVKPRVQRLRSYHLRLARQSSRSSSSSSNIASSLFAFGFTFLFSFYLFCGIEQKFSTCIPLRASITIRPARSTERWCLCARQKVCVVSPRLLGLGAFLVGVAEVATRDRCRTMKLSSWCTQPRQECISFQFCFDRCPSQHRRRHPVVTLKFCDRMQSFFRPARISTLRHDDAAAASTANAIRTVSCGRISGTTVCWVSTNRMSEEEKKNRFLLQCLHSASFLSTSKRILILRYCRHFLPPTSKWSILDILQHERFALLSACNCSRNYLH